MEIRNVHIINHYVHEHPYDVVYSLQIQMLHFHVKNTFTVNHSVAITSLILLQIIQVYILIEISTN